MKAIVVAVLAFSLSGCGKPLPKCKRGTVRVFCAITVYSADRVAPGEPAPTCLEKRDVSVTWCQKVEKGYDFKVVQRLMAYIAQTWNQTLPEFSRWGGFWAGPRTTRPPSPPCEFTEENPWPLLIPFDLDQTGRPPGTMPQGISGGEGGGPGLPVCQPTIPGGPILTEGAGGGSGSCGALPSEAPCTGAQSDCASCICSYTSNGYICL